jgi:hypothetical protein
MNTTRKQAEISGARGKTRKQGKLNLFYMARPVYGGLVSFTAHLALKHLLPLFMFGN